MANKKKTPIQRTWDYIKNNFRANSLDRTMPILFIMWAFSDIANDFGLDTPELEDLAEATYEAWQSCDVEEPYGNLTNFVDTAIDIFYDVELPEETLEGLRLALTLIPEDLERQAITI